MSSLFKLPSGVQDILPDECYNLNLIKDRLTKVFLQVGCNFIETPGIEYYDNFTKIKSPISQEKMFKMTDNDGKLLVVRPDITLSVARIAATKLKTGENKLCYFSSAYEALASGVNSREILQGGVEFLGVKSNFEDAMLIAAAIESIKATGLDGFIIEIGHIGFFQGLLDGSGISADMAEEIRKLINKKDLINVEVLLNEYNATKKTMDAILALPLLFGGEEVFEKAQNFTASKTALTALSDLKEVYNYLTEFGYEKYIAIDLGIVKSLSYYSGIVFSGIINGVGAPILTGGRYDYLSSEFGGDICAVGFAIGLKRILVALERQGMLTSRAPLDTLIAAERGSEAAAYKKAQELRKSGKTVELYAGNLQNFENYKKTKAAAEYLIVKGNDND